MFLSFLKVIATGNVIEIYEYEKEPLRCDDRKELKPESELPDWIKDMVNNNKTKEEYSRSNSIRTRNMIRRLCLANFNNHSKFVTLTFAENVIDLDQANREFKKFIQRMRYSYGDFKYIAVIEFQKRGAIHYHMISDLPYIPNKKLGLIWRNGYVKINDIEHVDNVGAYMCKYMLKDVNDNRLAGRKAYLTSKNLDRPLELRGKEAERIIELYKLDQKKEVYTNSYESEYLGKITYKEFNLKRI